MIAEQQTIETKIIQTESASHQRNANRVKRDEEELERLMRQARGETDEDTESESSSEESVEPEVQAESDTEQKEERKAEAQEDDAELSPEEKNFKKRYGDLRRHMQDKEKEFADKLAKLEKQLDAATKNELVLPKSNEEIEAWAKQHPDVAGIVEAIAAQKAEERAASLDERLKEIESLRTTAKREKAEAELIKYHPDFEQIREDDAFHDWASDQPKWVQDALYENSDDAKSVARVIDLYKTDKGITTKKNNSADKDAASSVKSRRAAAPEADESAGYFTESQVAKMSIKEYEKNMEAIIDSQRKGKFIYDLSKKQLTKYKT